MSMPIDVACKQEALEEIADIAKRNGLSVNDIVKALQQGETDQGERVTGILAKVLGYLGGIFVLAGVALTISMQWGYFNSPLRILVTLGVGFAVYLFALATLSDDRFEKITTPMFLIAALLQPTGIVVMLNEYSRGGDPKHGLLFMCVVMFVQQFFTFLAKKRTVLLFVSIFFGVAGFGTICDILGMNFELIALASGIGLMCIAYVMDKTVHKSITPFWYLAGSIFLLYGAFDLVEDSVVEILYFGIAGGVMYLGTVVRSRTLLFVSVLTLTSFTGYFFQDDLMNAFGLIVLGFLLVGLSAFAMGLNRKYIQGKS